MTHPSSFKKIPARELQDKFNREGFEERLRTGELHRQILKSHDPDPAYRQPEGAKSQTWALKDKWGRTLAKTHCFVDPDGKILASGRLDPLEIFDPESRTLYSRE